MSRNCFLATLCFVLFVGNNVVLLSAETLDTLFKVSRSENLYGKGVHAFFDRDYSGTIDLLTQAEQLGSEDPRPYYFLALAHSRLKQNDKADEYFKQAAQFEWEGQAVRDYNVSESLRRIQGNERLNLERYRTQAKLDWQNAEKQKHDILYAKERTDEKRILTEMAKHPVVVAPFGAQSIDPLKTGKKIEIPLSNDFVSQPKTESLKVHTIASTNDDTEKSKPVEETTLSKNEKENDEKENKENTNDTNEKKNEKEESEDDDPFK
jgi:tetratricopeptide (TPR) repeat protein